MLYSSLVRVLDLLTMMENQGQDHQKQGEIRLVWPYLTSKICKIKSMHVFLLSFYRHRKLELKEFQLTHILHRENPSVLLR